MLYGHSSALPKIAVGAARGLLRRSWHPVSTGMRRYPWGRPGESSGSCSRRPRVTVRRTCATGHCCSCFRHTACASGKCALCSSTTSTGRRRRYAFAVPRRDASTCSRCRAASENARAEDAATRESQREHEQVLDHHAVAEPHPGLSPVDLALLTRRRLEASQRPLGLSCSRRSGRTKRLTVS